LIHLQIGVAKSGKEIVDTHALLDSGAEGTFIDNRFVDRHAIKTTPLRKPITSRNVDGTKNKNGTIMHTATTDITVHGKTKKTKLFVSGLGKETVILGLPWLRKENPDVNWKEGTFRYRDELSMARIKTIIEKSRCNHVKPVKPWPKATVEEIPDEEQPVETLPDAEPIGPQEDSNLVDEPNLANETVMDNIALEQIPSPETSTPRTEEADLCHDDKINNDELIIAYIRGEPIISVFKLANDPLTTESDEPHYSYSHNTQMISRLIRLSTSPCYSFSSTVHICTKTLVSQKLAHDSEKDQEDKKKYLDELLLEQYRKYKRVFEKTASEHFPELKPWDHAIDLKPDFIPRDCKVYPLTPGEQTKMEEFLDENLKKGYIRPLKSPMASPFFFVSKKDTDTL
jgi:gag-polyprotein putative aspartyl protease